VEFDRDSYRKTCFFPNLGALRAIDWMAGAAAVATGMTDIADISSRS
jgi:hypothetical protein